MKSYKIDLVNEKGYYHKFKNGLQVFMVKDDTKSGFQISLTVRYGGSYLSLKNKKLKSGLAHFLEHQKFTNGEEDYTVSFEKLGATHINAYTSETETVYYVGTNENKEELTRKFLEMITSFNSTEESVKTERGIIEEEKNMYEDDIQSVVMENLSKITYNDFQNKEAVIGTYEDIRNTTLEDLKEAFDIFYVPNNMHIVVTGNFNKKEIFNIIKEKMGHLEKRKINIKPKKEIEEVNRKYIEEEKDIEVEKIAIALKVKVKDKIKSALYLRFYMLKNFYLTSDLIEKLKKDNVILDRLYMNMDIRDDLIVLLFETSVNKNDEFIKTMTNAFNNIEIDEKEFNMYKKMFISEYIRQFDSYSELNFNISSQIINFNTVDPHKGIELKKLNIEEYNEIVSSLNLNNYAISYVKRKGE